MSYSKVPLIVDVVMMCYTIRSAASGLVLPCTLVVSFPAGYMVFLLVAHCYYWSLVVTPGCMSVTAGSSRFVLALQMVSIGCVTFLLAFVLVEESVRAVTVCKPLTIGEACALWLVIRIGEEGRLVEPEPRNMMETGPTLAEFQDFFNGGLLLLEVGKNKGIVDSGCSRHMTGNKAYLAEFQDFNGGPVAFGDHFPVNALTSKVFSFMVKKGKHFSGKVTPLFASMLVQQTEDEGAPSERPSEVQPTPSPIHTSEVPLVPQTDPSPTHTSEVPVEPQTDPSPRPSPSTTIPDSIPESSGGNLGGHSSSDKSLSGNEGEMTLQSVYDLCIEPQTDSSPAHTSEVPIEPQTDPSPRPSPSTIILDSIPESSGGNLGGHSSSDKSLSGNEGEMTLQSVYDLCLSLCAQVSDQAKEIQHLKAQITKLKKQAKPVIKHHRAWMQSVSLKHRLARKRSSKKQWVHKESVSKQGRKFAKGEPSVQRDPLFDEIPEDTLDHMETENAQDVGRTRDIVGEEKEKGVELKDIEETDRPRPTSTRSLLTLKPLPKIDPKDKGKKKIEEEDESESESDGIPEAEKKFKQLASDEEMARKVQEEWEGEEERNRLAEEKATNEALIRNYDDIKARIEADRLLAEKLQEEEREQFTIEERAKFLHDTIAAQRKFLAQQRSEAIRNRPPTKNQLRNQMMTYLKHVGNFKHSELKTKKFEEIQALYEKIKRSDEDFISIGSAEDERLIKRMNEKEIDSSKNEMVKEESKEEAKEENKEEESTRKRKRGTRKKMKSRKRRFVQNTSEDDSEKENDELRLHLTIAPDEEKEDDKAEHLEEINQNVVIRSNGQKRYFSTLMRVLSIFDRDDLNAVYQLVMERYQDEIPKGFDRVLWGDLMIMFNPDDEDKFWNSQQDWNIVSWKLHGSSGVHTLVTEAGLVIHMLVEKKYPLRKKVLLQMLKLKLESEEDSTMALELIRFVKKLLAELEPEDSDGDEEDL
ncbi:hypothetical protein Tco_0084938 [Tanacetum coccineum]